MKPELAGVWQGVSPLGRMTCTGHSSNHNRLETVASLGDQVQILAQLRKSFSTSDAGFPRSFLQPLQPFPVLNFESQLSWSPLKAANPTHWGSWNDPPGLDRSICQSSSGGCWAGAQRWWEQKISVGILVVKRHRRLVGGLEYLDYVSIYWECHHPIWFIFFRGVGISSTRSAIFQGQSKMRDDVKSRVSRSFFWSRRTACRGKLSVDGFTEMSFQGILSVRAFCRTGTLC